MPGLPTPRQTRRRGRPIPSPERPPNPCASLVALNRRTSWKVYWQAGCWPRTMPRWSVIGGRCFPSKTFEGRRENLSQANKLSGTHATLLEALSRHRGKGQQKVTVEHVHVHEGGQAIVGNV